MEERQMIYDYIKVQLDILMKGYKDLTFPQKFKLYLMVEDLDVSIGIIKDMLKEHLKKEADLMDVKMDEVN